MQVLKIDYETKFLHIVECRGPYHFIAYIKFQNISINKILMTGPRLGIHRNTNILFVLFITKSSFNILKDFRNAPLAKMLIYCQRLKIFIM